MNSYSFPRPILRTISVRVPAATHDAAWIEGRAMKFVGWTATMLVVCLLAWLIAAAELVWLRALGGVLLAGVGALIGLRIGAQSAAAYVQDLHRLNKSLSDQQRELEDANGMLLKQSADSLATATSVKSA